MPHTEDDLDMVPLASHPAFAALVQIRLVCRARWFRYQWQTQESTQGRIPKGKSRNCFILSNIYSLKPKRWPKVCTPRWSCNIQKYVSYEPLISYIPVLQNIRKRPPNTKILPLQVIKKTLQTIKTHEKVFFFFSNSRNTILIKAAYQRSQLLSFQLK